MSASAPVARCWNIRRFGYVQSLSGRDGGAGECGPGEMIPAAQLLDGDSEAIRDSNQRVAAMCTIESVSGNHRGGGNGNDDGIDVAQIGGGA